MKESLNKVGDLLKVEKWTTIANKVTIKGLEENTASLISNPDDGSQIKSLIETKDIEIPNLNKQIKTSNVDPLHTVEINKVEQEKEEMLESVVKFKVIEAEKEKNISDLLAQITTLKSKSYTNS